MTTPSEPVDAEILREFLVESYENLDLLDREFVALESNPQDAARLAAIFRAVHSIKGTSGFLGFNELESLTHVGESLLAKLRDGKLTYRAEIANALLAMVDAIRAILAAVEHSGTEGTSDYSDLRATIVELGGVAPARRAEDLAPGLWEDEPPSTVMVDIVANAPAQTATTSRGQQQEVSAHETADDGRGATAADASVRVDVQLLDKLMNLVGELVLARNQILQFSVSSREAAFVATSQRIDLITTELQEGVMKTRMQPIGNVWSKFPRVVRDLATTCGKKVRVRMAGKETELDRTIVEAVKDPLTHIVRNAIDHGIELPEVRRRAGKDPSGTLSLRAYHSSGQVNIEISDDGAGLDADRIRKKAIERGLISIEQATRMSERELTQLVFLPGFSTAETVTRVSGRGVGMDVVRTNIEKIGGMVELESIAGRGTTLRIKIPLTLAIIPALIVTSAGERYAIPQGSLIELVHLEPEQVQTTLEYVHGTPVCRRRGKLLPIVFLSRTLGDVNAPATSPDGAMNIVVLESDGREFGLVVDAISDTEEIVVKPLGKELKGINVFAGATIMGDGRVALILDVAGLAQRIGLASSTRGRQFVETVRQDEGREQLLVFRSSLEGTMAVQLALVSRLEEISVDRVERAGSRSLVQYRGEIMPLIDVGALLDGVPTLPREGSLQVIVTGHGTRSVGLIVGAIVDIVEEQLAIKDQGRQRGVLGAAVVQGKITQLIDVNGIVRDVEPHLLESIARAS